MRPPTAEYPVVPYTGTPPITDTRPITAADVYQVNGRIYIRTTEGLVPLDGSAPPRPWWRHPGVTICGGLLIVAAASAAVWIVAYALYAVVGAGMAHAQQIGATLVVMVLTFLLLAAAVTRARHGYHPRHFR